MALQAQDDRRRQEFFAGSDRASSTYPFDMRDSAYRLAVLPLGVSRQAIEAGVTDYLRKYSGLCGDVLGIDTFRPRHFERFGFTSLELQREFDSIAVPGLARRNGQKEDL